MSDIKILPCFWFRPASPTNPVVFRIGVNPLLPPRTKDVLKAARFATDPKGSPVGLWSMETPAWDWKPRDKPFYHFGTFDTMMFLLKLYDRFMNYLSDPSGSLVYEPKLMRIPQVGNTYGLQKLINDNWNLSTLEDSPKILLADMTGHAGFPVPGHDTHNSGQQMDIHYIPEDGTNTECFCPHADLSGGPGKVYPGKKPWHLGLNALLLHCILEAGASWVVTDSKELRDNTRPPVGVTLKPSTRNNGNPVHENHFHVEVNKVDPRGSKLVKDLYGNPKAGLPQALSMFNAKGL